MAATASIVEGKEPVYALHKERVKPVDIYEELWFCEAGTVEGSEPFAIVSNDKVLFCVRCEGQTEVLGGTLHVDMMRWPFDEEETRAVMKLLNPPFSFLGVVNEPPMCAGPVREKYGPTWLDLSPFDSVERYYASWHRKPRYNLRRELKRFDGMRRECRGSVPREEFEWLCEASSRAAAKADSHGLWDPPASRDSLWRIIRTASSRQDLRYYRIEDAGRFIGGSVVFIDRPRNSYVLSLTHGENEYESVGKALYDFVLSDAIGAGRAGIDGGTLLFEIKRLFKFVQIDTWEAESNQEASAK